MTTGALRTIFVIPGFKENGAMPQYRSLKKLLARKGLSIIIAPIRWDRRCMSDWVDEFSALYNKKKGTHNTVLGFSYGAMIAAISAPHLKPNELHLCSLSPYFQEDLPRIPTRWKTFIGKKRIANFEKYSIRRIAKKISTKTTIFLGALEVEKWPIIAQRTREAQKLITGSRVIIIDSAPHDIGNANYQAALNAHIS